MPKTVFYCPIEVFSFPGMTFDEFNEIDDCYEPHFLEDYIMRDTAHLKPDAEESISESTILMAGTEYLSDDFPDVLPEVASAESSLQEVGGRLWLCAEYTLNKEVDTERLRDFAAQCIVDFVATGEHFQKGDDLYLVNIDPYRTYNQTNCAAPLCEENLLLTEEEIHITERITMTEERMNRMMETTPGIGVKVTRDNGNEVCYFYEDFDGSGSGIKRAMEQLYPLHDKGIIKKLCFIELDRSHAVNQPSLSEAARQPEQEPGGTDPEQAGSEQAPGLTM